MLAYTTIKAQSEAGFTEKRSRFIGSIKPCGSEEEAAAFIAEQKSRRRDAAHNCSAYVLRSGCQRYSDDGEPQGTAGMPILEVLRRENIVDAVIVVTRYFGGILLGAGGLARAYSHAAKLALDSAEMLTMQPCTVFSVKAPYPLYDRINLLIAEYGVVALESDFGEDISLRLRIPENRLGGFAAELSELSAGKIRPQILGETFA